MSKLDYIARAAGIGLGLIVALVVVLQSQEALQQPTMTPVASLNLPKLKQFETPPSPAPSRAHVALTDVGGFKIPLGEPYALFVEDHPGWDCLTSTSFTLCENQTPRHADCPAGMPCDAMVYHFREGRLSGFSASYEENGYWGYMLARRMQRSPASFAVLPVIGNMQTRAWRWATSGGHLTFFLHDGHDIYGLPIRLPFQISFSPERFAPHLAGEEVGMDRPTSAPAASAPAAIESAVADEARAETVENLLRQVERESKADEAGAAE